MIPANTFPGEIGDGYGGHEDGSSVQPAQQANQRNENAG
jgi:hypothetical protein